MTGIDRRGVAKVLARIKTYHAPQDVGESVISSWADAFAYAGVTNAADAEAAVVRHFTTPGTNQWVTPGDIIGHYNALRWDRIKNYLDDGALTPDVPGWAHGSVHARTAQARAAAIMDGTPFEVAVGTIQPIGEIPPMHAIEGPQ